MYFGGYSAITSVVGGYDGAKNPFFLFCFALHIPRILRRGFLASFVRRWQRRRVGRGHHEGAERVPSAHRPQHVPRWVGARTSAHEFRGGESQPRVGHREWSRGLRGADPREVAGGIRGAFENGRDRVRFLPRRARRRGHTLRLLLGGGEDPDLGGEAREPARVFRIVLRAGQPRRAEGDRIPPPGHRRRRLEVHERRDESNLHPVRLFGTDVGNAVQGLRDESRSRHGLKPREDQEARGELGRGFGRRASIFEGEGTILERFPGGGCVRRPNGQLQRTGVRHAEEEVLF